MPLFLVVYLSVDARLEGFSRGIDHRKNGAFMAKFPAKISTPHHLFNHCKIELPIRRRQYNRIHNP